ncbi:MAG: rRNA maturation RNase YbeY [bacterium]|nr:rRNA maturation RNase YbeY [bacterium]
MSKLRAVEVQVSNPARSPITIKEIDRISRAVLTRLRNAHLRCISVALVTVPVMRRLNRTRRGIDRATDVLSFSFGSGGGGVVDGEVVLCYPYLKDQAKRVGVPLREEVTRMLIHGILHLAGHDHEKPKDAAVMFPLQERYLKAIL